VAQAISCLMGRQKPALCGLLSFSNEKPRRPEAKRGVVTTQNVSSSAAKTALGTSSA
jgi:hypothetical protein